MNAKDQATLLSLLTQFEESPQATQGDNRDKIIQLCADIIDKHGCDYNYYLTTN